MLSALVRAGGASLGWGRQLLAVMAAVRGWTDERPLAGPLCAQISASDVCDQRCMMCPYHAPHGELSGRGAFGGAPPGVLPLGVFRGVVDDLRRLGTRRLDLVGRGEPLLNPHAVAMAGYATHRGLKVSLTTNGSRLDRATAEAFVAMGLDEVRLSLNAGNAETYARVHAPEPATGFARTLGRLRDLAAARARRGQATPGVTVSCAVGAFNFRQLTDVVAAAAAAGGDAVHFHLALPYAGASAPLEPAHRRELIAEHIPAAAAAAAAAGTATNLEELAAMTAAEGAGPPPPVPCYVGYSFVVVLGNGKVLPCCQTQSAVGSVNGRRLRDVWTDEPYRVFRRAARALPTPHPALADADCGRCYFRAHNRLIHAVAHPTALVGSRELVRLAAAFLARPGATLGLARGLEWTPPPR